MHRLQALGGTRVLKVQVQSEFSKDTFSFFLFSIEIQAQTTIGDGNPNLRTNHHSIIISMVLSRTKKIQASHS